MDLREWVQARSPHFDVISNAGAKRALEVVRHLERIRAVYQKVLPEARIDPGRPIAVYAARDEETLKDLLPSFWKNRRQVRPSGYFRFSPDGQFIALRVDSRGPDPYSTLNHEYFHLITEMNIPRLPVWLKEGLAGFWENTRIRGRSVELGRPNEDFVRILGRRELIPLETLFEVDESSPYYEDAHRAAVFYAQSWALTHYLVMGDETGRAKGRLLSYVRLLQSGMAPAEAQKLALEDLAELENALKSYVDRSAFELYKMNLSVSSDLDIPFVVQDLSSAQAAARLGDFIVRGPHFAGAEPLFRKALLEEPSLARAHVGMGLCQLRRQRRREALTWFETAAALGTESCLAHYYCAALRLDHGTGEAELETAVKSLERATELNPDFAPALAQLAFAYGLQNRNLEEALRLTQKAIELEPTNSFLYLNAGQFSMSLNRIEDARSYAERGLTVSGESKVKGLLQSFLNRLNRGVHQGPDREPPLTGFPLRSLLNGGWFEGEVRREEALTHLLNPDFSG